MSVFFLLNNMRVVLFCDVCVNLQNEIIFEIFYKSCANDTDVKLTDDLCSLNVTTEFLAASWLVFGRT